MNFCERFFIAFAKVFYRFVLDKNIKIYIIMKKLLLLFVNLLLSVSISADDIPLLPPDGGHNGDPIPQHAPTLLPSADYTNGVLTIYSIYAIEDMTVIIKDADGEVLYSTMVDVLNTAILYLPTNILNSMATLEIIYGDCHLYGEF